MSDTPRIKSIKGFADLFAPDSDAFTRIERAAREVFTRYAFGELRTPLLEETRLFSRSIGEETDVVSKEMYTFPDRKGRSLTLRPEATAGVMRAFIESNRYQPGGVYRYYTLGPMFRYERPQKGRMRQFHQVNAELIGSPAPQADAEVILMLADFLTALGIGELSFELNTLGCRECRPAFRGALTSYFAALSDDALCADCLRRRDVNPLRVLDCKVEGCKAATAGAPKITDCVCGDCRARFDTVIGIVERAGLAYTLNPRLVRGLDYYQGTTFEVTSGKIGSQSSVAGGGRYDGLISALGGPDVPGVGFACGMERLALLLDAKTEAACDFFVAPLAPLGPNGLAEALFLARVLREAGYSGEVAYEARSAKSLLRQAGKAGARKCLILGPEELAAGTAVVKDLTTGEQAICPRADILNAFL